MPTIRELVGAIAQRQGVEAALVLGRDGLLIDGRCADPLDGEGLAARVPGILSAADELGVGAERGPAGTVILEYPSGLAIVSVLSSDVVLLVLLQATANVGQLLFELRRHREQIGALV